MYLPRHLVRPHPEVVLISRDGTAGGPSSSGEFGKVAEHSNEEVLLSSKEQLEDGPAGLQSPLIS